MQSNEFKIFIADQNFATANYACNETGLPLLGSVQVLIMTGIHTGCRPLVRS